MLNHYQKEDHAFVKRVSHLVEPFQTKFLNLNEQEIIKQFHKNLHFTGGNSNSERKRAYTDYEPGIVCFLVEVASSKPIKHQNVFGSLINIGLKQEMLGDVIVQDQIYIFVAEEVSEFVENEFRVNNLPTTLTKVDPAGVEIIDQYESITIVISSVRLDNFVSNVYNISRNEAKSLILKSFVRVNHKLVENPSAQVMDHDLISVRTKGRFVVLGQLGTSKKDNLIYEVGKY